ncbi:MAG: hypothetical protein ABIR63_07130 [Sphingomicrobium sp.]
MTAALATLTFLSAIWLLVVLGAKIMEQSGPRIAAALKGRSLEPALATAPMRLRHGERAVAAYRATLRLRAAA